MGVRDPFLERMTVIPLGDDVLEGLFHRGQRIPPCLILPPLPELGGSMETPVCIELSWALSRAGHATLRFNYRGVGASTGRRPDDLDLVEDVGAGVEQLVTTVEVPRVCLVGYSFGAFVGAAAALRDPRVSHLVLVAPPTRRYAFDWPALAARDLRLHAIFAEHDDYCDREATSAAVISAGGAISLVLDADHFFSCGLDRVGRLAAEAVAR
ncbi:MAG: alpha/beta fold hydrolase [Deltaproteobacteria bacterium]|nr:alpha/beta fold hydrolase [Deltaproteobacteria bacterium]